MRIVVCPHQMVMGGSQINALELAEAIQRIGHEVIIYAPQGILIDFAKKLNLEVVLSPDCSSRISLKWMRGLVSLVKKRHVDLVHAYEWGPSSAAIFSAQLFLRTPIVMTVFSMDIPDFLPTHVPMIVGTKQLHDQQLGRRSVMLLEPMIDVDLNAPSDSQSSRERWNIADDEFVVGVVCRLTADLEKLDGVMTAIDVCQELAKSMPIRFVIAGDGEGMVQVQSKIDAAVRDYGTSAVIATGNLIDPSSVYSSSDVIIGMGSSALKGMAYQKPLIVQGAAGFWKLLTKETQYEFLEDGWYGKNGGGADDLKRILVQLEGSEEMRESLGVLGRELVRTRFSLSGAAEVAELLYKRVLFELKTDSPDYWDSISRSAIGLAKFRTVMRWKEFRVALRRRLR